MRNSEQKNLSDNALKRLKRFWKKLGPGLVTGASDDDPSGIATYTQAGAQFGFSTLWTAFFTYPLMTNIQGMCARIGLITSEGLTGTLKKHYSKTLLFIMLFFSIPAIVFNIGANIAAVGAVGNLMIPQVDASFFSVFFTVSLLFGMVYFSYEKIAKILKYLCLSLMLYLAVPFFTDIQITEIIADLFMPKIEFNTAFLSILVAILGTTISPYLFYWQATMVAEDVKHRKKRLIVDGRIIHEIESDVDFGILFSNIVMLFIMLTAGSVLHKNGITEIQTVDQAALALKPLAGNAAYLLFSLGIIGTGYLSIPVLSGSLSYMFCETFNWTEGLDKKFGEAKIFYMIIAISLLLGLSLNYMGIPPFKALIYSAILYGMTAPVLIAIILHISNNKNIMGKFTNSRKANFLGILTLIIMLSAAIALIFI